MWFKQFKCSSFKKYDHFDSDQYADGSMSNEMSSHNVSRSNYGKRDQNWGEFSDTYVSLGIVTICDNLLPSKYIYLCSLVNSQKSSLVFTTMVDASPQYLANRSLTCVFYVNQLALLALNAIIKSHLRSIRKIWNYSKASHSSEVHPLLRSFNLTCHLDLDCTVIICQHVITGCRQSIISHEVSLACS